MPTRAAARPLQQGARAQSTHKLCYKEVNIAAQHPGLESLFGRPGSSREEMHDTLETEEAALGAACRALHPPPGRDPEPVLRIEGPNGERISLEEIEEYCRRIPR
jgi:hypothetical protein